MKLMLNKLMKTMRPTMLGLLLVIVLNALTASAFYDPHIGRFLSRDPIGKDGGINLYGFVVNSPISHVDLLGLEDLYILEPWTWPPDPGADEFPKPADYNNGCCDADNIAAGERVLKAKYNAAKKILDDNGIERDAYNNNGKRLSCVGSANVILSTMMPTPRCWTCFIERRSKFPYPYGGNIAWDENAIVCVSHPSSETQAQRQIVFDWFDKRPAGDDYKNFRKDYPYPLYELYGAYTYYQPAPYNDCKSPARFTPYGLDLINKVILP